MMQKGFYINLDQDDYKRKSIEQIIQKNNLVDYQRFTAVDSQTSRHPSMVLKGGEKGCFLSHYSILKQNENTNSILHILEDDAIFNHKINNVVTMISSLDENAWDIIFTDVLVQADLSSYFEFTDLYKTYKNSGTVQVLNLKGRSLTGTTSYLVNPNSLSKLIQLIETNINTQHPYDLFLRSLVDSDQLKASVMIPMIPFFSYPKYFKTESSLRQLSTIDKALMKLRESFWIDADTEGIIKELTDMSLIEDVSQHAKVYGEFFKVVSDRM